MMRISASNLTFLSIHPLEQIEILDEVGYDFLGFRVLAPPERLPFPLVGNPGLVSQVATTLANARISAYDAEVLRVEENLRLNDVERALEVAQEIGCSVVTVNNFLSDGAALSHAVDALGDMFGEYDLVPMIEPMSFSATNTVEFAARIARDMGGKILIDPLHFARIGQRFEELDPKHHADLPLVQLCDGLAPYSLASDDSVLREAFQRRMAPGTGEFELEKLLEILQPLTVLSIECPDHARLASIGTRAYAFELKQAVEDLVVRSGVKTRPR